MTTITVPVIPGDGVGPEIWQSSQSIFNAALSKVYQDKQKINWLHCWAGQAAFEQKGSYLPNETLSAIKEHKLAIKGPLTTPVGGGIRSINVTLRQTFDLYACVRPVKWYPNISSPVHHPEKVKMVVFRENTEDIYAGIEWSYQDKSAKELLSFLQTKYKTLPFPFPETTSFGIKPVSRQGSERLIHAAIHYALTNHQKSVTLVHKGNIMKFTEGGFRDWGYEYAESVFKEKVFTENTFNKIKTEKGVEFANAAKHEAQLNGKVWINDCICDAFFQNALLRPEDYHVIATLNLNGDYISDALAAQVGGIGISPGANINYETGYAIFEATHGTAPTIAGQNKANPSALLLSGVMLFDFLGWHEVKTCIELALEKTILDGIVTSDLAVNNEPSVTTSEFTQAIISRL